MFTCCKRTLYLLFSFVCGETVFVFVFVYFVCFGLVFCLFVFCFFVVFLSFFFFFFFGGGGGVRLVKNSLLHMKIIDTSIKAPIQYRFLFLKMICRLQAGGKSIYALKFSTL